MGDNARAWQRTAEPFFFFAILTKLMEDMDALIPLLAAISILNLGLGLLVYTRDSRKLTHKSFFALCVSFVVWGIFIAFMFDSGNVWFARGTFAAGIGMGYFLVLFTSNFPAVIRFPRVVRVIGPLLGLFFLPFCLTDAILVQFQPTQIIGPLFIPYMMWIGTFFMWGFGNLITQFRRSKPLSIERRQIFLMLLGLAVMLVLAFITNGILPVFEGTPKYVQYSPLFSIAFIGCTAIALLRYQLFNIKVLLTETAVTFLVLVLLAEMFTTNSILSGVEHSVIFIVGTFVGVLLIYSVRKEVRRSEELALLTEALSNANAKLKVLDAQKTEFLSIASHQLRTPLAAMRGYLDLMVDGAYGKLSKTQSEAVSKVGGNLGGLISLVGELLSVSRIESGRTNVEIQPVDVAPICKDVASFLEGKAAERRLALSCEKKKVPLVYGDPEKLREVMMNLTENALKYTDTGWVKLSFVEEPRFLRVEVRDTGLGLSTANIEKLFQKFSRVESSTVAHAGTGLGLYVCKRLVDAMGGEIWAESKGLGKGSAFIFRLKKVPSGTKVKTKITKVV